VLGEMVPKNLAISTPERAALLLGPPMFWIIQFTKPFIWVLNALANACVRALRIEPVSEVANHHSPEDLAAMARQSFERGLLDPTERALAEATLKLHETAARRVMTPWDSAVTVPPEVTAAELEGMVLKTRHTRFPVADDRVDRYVHANSLLTVDGADYERLLPEAGYHALPSVTAETSLADVLTLMQEGRVELAAVREDSHVVGIVSLADVLRVLIPA
jgi:CBS domain containing-hemolysin-like protein